MQILLTTSRAIYESTAQWLDLIARTADIAVSVANTLIYSPSITEELIVATITAYNPDKIWILAEGRLVDNEHQVGDIIMPNVFLRANHEIDGVEFTKANQDAYLHDPLFLRHFERQSDMDFEKFGLSVGGICVTSPEGMDIPTREQLEFAYQADCVDEVSYEIIDAARRLERSEIMYPVLLITEANMLPERLALIAQNIAPVINYIQSDTTNDNDREDDRI